MYQTALIPAIPYHLEQSTTGADTVFPTLAQEFFKVPRGCRLERCPPAVWRRLELQPLRDAAAWEASLSLDLAAGKPLFSKAMDGREYLFSRFPVYKTGPQEMTGCADVSRVGEQCPAGGTTVQVHLLFDRDAKVLLHYMEPVCDLCCLWRALTGSLSVETAAIPADHLHLGMVLQPLGAGDHITIPKDIENRPAFLIDDDCPVRLGFLPTPIINADDTRATGALVDCPQQLPEYRVIADLNSQMT